MSNDYTIILTHYQIDEYDCDPYEIEEIFSDIEIEDDWDDAKLYVSGPEETVKKAVAMILNSKTFEEAFKWAEREGYGIIEVKDGSEKVLFKPIEDEDEDEEW